MQHGKAAVLLAANTTGQATSSALGMERRGRCWKPGMDHVAKSRRAAEHRPGRCALLWSGKLVTQRHYPC